MKRRGAVGRKGKRDSGGSAVARRAGKERRDCDPCTKVGRVSLHAVQWSRGRCEARREVVEWAESSRPVRGEIDRKLTASVARVEGADRERESGVVATSKRERRKS